MRIALVLLPVLVVIASAGGYFIAGRTLNPIQKIAGTARKIGAVSYTHLEQRISEIAAGNAGSGQKDDGHNGTGADTLSLIHIYTIHNTSVQVYGVSAFVIMFSIFNLTNTSVSYTHLWNK